MLHCHIAFVLEVAAHEFLIGLTAGINGVQVRKDGERTTRAATLYGDEETSICWRCRARPAVVINTSPTICYVTFSLTIYTIPTYLFKRLGRLTGLHHTRNMFVCSYLATPRLQQLTDRVRRLDRTLLRRRFNIKKSNILIIRHTPPRKAPVKTSPHSQRRATVKT